MLTDAISDGDARLVSPDVIYEEDFILNSTYAAKAVLFGVEGWREGSSSRQYLAIFLRNTPKKDAIQLENTFKMFSLNSFIKVGEGSASPFNKLEVSKNIIKITRESLTETKTNCWLSTSKIAKFKIELNEIHRIGKNG